MENQIEKFRGIAEELKRMYEADQQMRRRFLGGHGSWDETMDRRNTARLKEIIQEMGWPSISKVGKQGSSHAWALAQHADHEPEFQKSALSLMKSETENEVDRANIAFLEDRVAVGDGKPQIYGTQFYKNPDSQMQPRPILDVKNIERRRKKIGLETFKEYQKAMRAS